MISEQRFYLLQYFIRGDRAVENRRLVRAQDRVLRSDRIHSEEFLVFLQRSTRNINHHWVQENMQLFHRPYRLLCPRHLRRLHGHSAYRYLYFNYSISEIYFNKCRFLHSLKKNR